MGSGRRMRFCRCTFIRSMTHSHVSLRMSRRALDINPRDYRAWYGLGQTYEILQMHFYSLHYFRKATALRPYDARMWCAMGQCYEYVVLQYVAVCCNVLRRVAACCSVLLRVAACCRVLQHVTACYSVLQCVASDARMRCAMGQCYK